MTQNLKGLTLDWDATYATTNATPTQYVHSRDAEPDATDAT